MKTFRYLIITIIIFLLAFLFSFVIGRISYGERDIKRFQKKLNSRYELLDKYAGHIFRDDTVAGPRSAEKSGLILLLYKNDRLSYWSDNTIHIPVRYKEIDFSKRFIFLANTWFVVKKYQYKNQKLVGLVFIKKEYLYENDFVKNHFQKNFRLPPQAEILDFVTDNTFSIYDWDKNYLFSIRFNGEKKYRASTGYIAAALYFLGIILMLIFLYSLAGKEDEKVPKRNWKIAVITLFLILLRTIFLIFRFPDFLNDLELFSPLIYGHSVLIPSLGDLMVDSILIFFIVFLVKTKFYLSNGMISGHRFRGNLMLVILSFISVVFIYYSYFIFKSLILNSSISFEMYKVTELTAFSFVALFIVALNYASLVLLFDKIYGLCYKACSIQRMIVVFSVVEIFTVGLFYFLGNNIDLVTALFFYLFFIFLGILRYHNKRLNAYSILVLLVLLLALYTIYFTGYHIKIKNTNVKKVLAENLANEHDPVAEYLLEDISTRLSSDSNIVNLLSVSNFNIDNIYSYLRKNYFNGFWTKYITQVAPCTPSDSVLVGDPDNKSYHCHQFFNHLITERGIKLPNSRFYYIDNQNGRISYLGSFTYYLPVTQENVTLFIELDSRLLSTVLGYPELLLRNNFSRDDLLRRFSYAKYNQGGLIAQSGDFQYSRELDVYGKFDKQFTTLSFGDYDHLIYRIDKNNTIIVSSNSISTFDYLVSFSYIFVFFYLLIVASFITLNFSVIKKGIELNFKNKIQFSIIIILLISLVFIGGGTIYFSIRQYKDKQLDNLSEKIQSVYVEIERELSYEDKISPFWYGDGYDNLDQLLIKFSDVFYTDINLYDPNGNLLATSRPEIFDLGLQGNMINPEAFEKLKYEQQALYVHKESIGKLSYLSAYVPFINVDNKLLAYLNLPYFTKQNVLKQDITTLVVAIVNIYVLLILLTIAVAVFISDQITRPLRMIQQKFSEIELGKKYEQIQYRGKDEIGSLVREYNRMVDELEKSIDLLAKSEREMAWREMAKQIAHEIKNPLTPMKLSVQHLLRAWQDSNENYGEYLERVSRTLIEQIDNLSTIASEFSNFAKMPRANNQKVNLVDTIKDIVDLFGDSKKTEVLADFHGNKELYVFADKEQLSRVFINLVKNAIQSIPEKREGKILIDINHHDQLAMVRINDNGKGIPEELRDKLFMPNFTTKSSGMGLGLAIVKNIVENIKGKITFETLVDHGTTFIVEIPVYKKDK